MSSTLKKLKTCCRVCLQPLVEGSDSMVLTQFFKNQFKAFTTMELNPSDQLSNLVCRSCYTEFLRFSGLKKNLMSNQHHVNYLLAQAEDQAKSAKTKPKAQKIEVKVEPEEVPVTPLDAPQPQKKKEEVELEVDVLDEELIDGVHTAEAELKLDEWSDEEFDEPDDLKLDPDFLPPTKGKAKKPKSERKRKANKPPKTEKKPKKSKTEKKLKVDGNFDLIVNIAVDEMKIKGEAEKVKDEKNLKFDALETLTGDEKARLVLQEQTLKAPRKNKNPQKLSMLDAPPKLAQGPLTITQMPLKCRGCFSTFKTLAALRIHQIAVHNGKNLWKCIYCSRRAKTQMALRSHVHAVHRRDYAPYKCKCGETFNSLLALHQHENWEHEKKKKVEKTPQKPKLTEEMKDEILKKLLSDELTKAFMKIHVK